MIWNPIETAPKDGTEIVLYCPENGPYIGKWMEKGPVKDNSIEYYAYRRAAEGYEMPHFQPRLLSYFGCGTCCRDFYVPTPTHWVPLPKGNK